MSDKWLRRDRKRQAKRNKIHQHGRMLKNSALAGVAAEAVEKPVRGKRRKRQR